MKYAVIQNGGNQYLVTEGQFVDMEKLEGDKGQEVTFSEVLLIINDTKTEIGQPLLKDRTVTAEIAEQHKGDKIEVYKFKHKSRYRRHTGHRQQLTKVKIKGIN